MRCFILFEELLRACSQDSSNKIKPLFTNKADLQVCHQLSIKIFEIDFLEILSEATLKTEYIRVLKREQTSRQLSKRKQSRLKKARIPRWNRTKLIYPEN